MKNLPDGESVRENHNLFGAVSNKKEHRRRGGINLLLQNHLLSNGENLDGQRYFFFQRSVISFCLQN